MATSTHGADLTREMLSRVQERLETLSAGHEKSPQRLMESMSYGLCAPAKRARALLALLVTASWERDWLHALDSACAIEMVHAASLIIDDLPVMDDAATRRGQPTNHRIFGESTAILSAIALLNEAYAVIGAAGDLQPDQQVAAIRALARAVGPDGLTGGQEEDLHGAASSVEAIEFIHARKTGALFAAATEIGTIVANISGPRLALMTDFGMRLGLGFQGLDDLLDAGATSASIGKDISKDSAKPTLVGLLGIEEAERRAMEHVSIALDCLEASGAQTDALRGYVEHLMNHMREKLVYRREAS